MLHSASLAFTHPATGRRMRFEAPVPEAFQAAVDKWKNDLISFACLNRQAFFAVFPCACEAAAREKYT